MKLELITDCSLGVPYNKVYENRTGSNMKVYTRGIETFHTVPPQKVYNELYRVKYRSLSVKETVYPIVFKQGNKNMSVTVPNVTSTRTERNKHNDTAAEMVRRTFSGRFFVHCLKRVSSYNKGNFVYSK